MTGPQTRKATIESYYCNHREIAIKQTLKYCFSFLRAACQYFLREGRGVKKRTSCVPTVPNLLEILGMY